MTGKRPRIKKGKPIVVNDELEFVKNKSSEKAQKAEEFDERIKIITWFDKHYLDRLQFGDENGKRAGIEKEQVIKLVRDAIKHLVYYSFKVKGFAFIDDDAPLGKHLRIILLKEDNCFSTVPLSAFLFNSTNTLKGYLHFGTLFSLLLQAFLRLFGPTGIMKERPYGQPRCSGIWRN